jgi:membrane protein YdbS with pleckstrin-like domain
LSDNPEGRTGPDLDRQTPQLDVSAGESPASRDTAFEVTDGRYHRLDPRWITATRLTGAIWVAILALVTGVGLFVILLAGDAPAAVKILLVIVWFALGGLFAVWTLVWPPIRYRYAAYRVSRDGIEIRGGVLWRSVVSVPRSRVQHTDVNQGPLARSFGLATLILHTAGTEHAAVPLSGLPRDRAYAVRDHLLGGGEDDAV